MKLGVKRIMIKQILKYQGNDKYICILGINEKDELFIFYALTGKLSIEINEEKEEYDISGCQRLIFCCSKDYEVKIPIKVTKNSHLFHIIKIDNEKEYEHICAVVESLA